MKAGFRFRYSKLLLAVLIAAGFMSPHMEAASSQPELRAFKGGVIRALAIGIDQYPNLSERDQLSGAAADAEDIASSLKRMGVADVTLLLDTAATRSAFTNAMESLIAKANEGDLIVVTFAGHGMKEQERVTGSEPDGMDEVFVLSLIASEGPNTSERIIDDEIFDWLQRLAKKGADIIFVADSCHGGGMTKAPSRGATRRGVRGIRRVYNANEAGPGALYIAPESDRLSVPANIAASDNATFQIPSLTFLAGVDSQSEVLELTIDGQKRGALSYAFARALDGSKLAGDITREMLFKSVHENVLQLTEHRQSPVMEPRMAETVRRVLFRKSGAGSLKAAATMQAPETKIVTLEGSETAEAPSGLYAFWDKSTGDVISETGSVLAFGMTRDALPAVARRVSSAAALVRLAAQAPLRVAIQPHKLDFASGEPFRLVVEGVYGRNLIIVNLAGSGEVQYLFPAGNANPLMLGERLEIPMRAAPPFGTDTLIVLASKQRQNNLELDLDLLDKRSKPHELLGVIQDRLKEGDLLGVISYTTRP